VWVVRGYSDETRVAIQRMGLMGHIGPTGECHIGVMCPICWFRPARTPYAHTPTRRYAHTLLRFSVFAQSQLLKGSVDIPKMLPQGAEPG
jgi:hypothetical protein